MALELRHKINQVFFLTVLAAAVFILTPPQMMWETELFSRYDFYLRSVILAAAGVRWLVKTVREKRIDGILICFGLFALSLVISAGYNGGSLKTAVWSDAVVPATVFLVIADAMDYDRKLAVRAVYCLFLVYIICNLAVLIRMKEEIGEFRSVYDLNSSFLGNRNCHIYYYSVFLFAGYYGFEKGYLKSRLLYLGGLSVCLVSAVIADGLTAKLALGIWILFLLAESTGCLKKLEVRHVVFFNAAVFFGLQYYALTGAEWLTEILELFGKNGNFGDRTPVWNACWSLFPGSPLFGYGDPDMFSLIGQIHAHSLYLQILLDRGLLGFTLFVLLIAELCSAVSRVKNRRIYNGMAAFLLILMLVSQVDQIMVPTFYSLYAALICYSAAGEVRDAEV